jgi:hypothetical protein
MMSSKARGSPSQHDIREEEAKQPSIAVVDNPRSSSKCGWLHRVLISAAMTVAREEYDVREQPKRPKGHQLDITNSRQHDSS